MEQVQVIMKEDEFNEISSDEEDHRDVDVPEAVEKQTLLCPIGSCKFFLSAVDNSLQQSHPGPPRPRLLPTYSDSLNFNTLSMKGVFRIDIKKIP